MDEWAQDGIMGGRTVRSSIAPTQRHIAFHANEIKPFEVIALAQWLLSAIGAFDGEEFAGYDGVAVLRGGMSNHTQQ